MESTNIGFYSSLVERGTGKAVVIAIGNNTVLGKMSNMTRANSNNEITGLHRQINRMVLFVILATIVGIIILWIIWPVWLKYGHQNFFHLTDIILDSIGMIAGFLPISMPSAITLSK
jgi:magnesium-transporting ATPase (P-type)